MVGERDSCTGSRERLVPERLAPGDWCRGRLVPELTELTARGNSVNSGTRLAVVGLVVFEGVEEVLHV